MIVIDYDDVAVKHTPFGTINVYQWFDSYFVLTEDAFTLAHVYARMNNWRESDIKTIGATFPF